MKNSAVFLAGARTPIGAFQGSLSSLTTPQLGAHALRAAIARSGVKPEDIDEVLMGCVLAGGLGQAPARQAAKAAGIPDSAPCTTVNKVCGSGMKTVMQAAQAILLGDAEVVAAGGMESMSNAPYILPKARSGYRMGHGQLIDTMVHDGLWDPYSDQHMGSCGDLCAAEFNFSREDLDAFAAQSCERSISAQNEGRLTDEIEDISIPQRRGDPVVVSEDEGPGKARVEKLPKLRAAFGKDGVTTAGNASSINDGAAALIMTSGERAEAEGLETIGKLVAYTQHAQAPEWFTTAPAAAVSKLLAKTDLTVADIDLFEINEAFAAVAMHTAQTVGIPNEKLNVNGGAVCLGHPIGMTGTRLILTALYELKRRGGGRAICSPCIGGGEATAVLIEV